MSNTIDQLQADIWALYETMGEKPPRQWRSRTSARQYRNLFSALLPVLTPETRVLDWGSGNGEFSWWMTRMGLEVAALDLSPPLLQPQIERLPSGRWSWHSPSDPSSLPFADGSFDAVLSIGVLEHVRDTGGDEWDSLTEIRRVLAPGGTFVCDHLPSRGSWIEFLARRSNRRHSHNQRYRRSEIVQMFTPLGLEIQEIRRYGVLPRNEATRLPRAGTALVAATFDILDRLLEIPLSPLATNYLVVARRGQQP